MTGEKYEELAEELYNDLNDDLNVHDNTLEQLEDKFEQFLNMGVSGESARESIIRSMANEAGVDRTELLDTSLNQKNISEIDEDDEYVSVKVELDDEWNVDTDMIGQKGLVTDGTGRIAFVNWSNSKTPLLSDTRSYFIKNASVTKNNGYNEIHFQDYTEVEMIDEDVVQDTGSSESEDVVFSGMIVDVLDNSKGIYRECSVEDCYEKGLYECGEHGDSLGDELQSRVRASVDDGENTCYVYLYEEQLEKLGFDKDKAKTIVMSYDTDKLIEDVRQELLFEKVEFTCSEIDGNYYCNDVEVVDKVDSVPNMESYSRESYAEFELADFDRVEEFVKEGSGEYASTKAVLDDGSKVNRVILNCIISSIEHNVEDDYDYVVMNLMDEDGNDKEVSVLYNDQVKNHLIHNVETPSRVTIQGKVKSFEEDGEIKPTLSVESIK